MRAFRVDLEKLTQIKSLLAISSLLSGRHFWNSWHLRL
jgi:hypothetical protein